MNRESGNASTHEPWTRRTYIAAAVTVIVAAACGVLVGRWASNRLAERQAHETDLRWSDEIYGLAPRSGIAKDLALEIRPQTLTVRVGQPVRLRLCLVNKGTRSVNLNSWLTPFPARHKSNQFPLKVQVSISGKEVPYHGDPVVLPPHKKRDFSVLKPGETREIVVDMTSRTGYGAWDMSAPGTYQVCAWYETYLSGRYAGVNAWTGMTNAAVAQVIVHP